MWELACGNFWQTQWRKGICSHYAHSCRMIITSGLKAFINSAIRFSNSTKKREWRLILYKYILCICHMVVDFSIFILPFLQGVQDGEPGSFSPPYLLSMSSFQFAHTLHKFCTWGNVTLGPVRVFIALMIAVLNVWLSRVPGGYYFEALLVKCIITCLYLPFAGFQYIFNALLQKLLSNCCVDQYWKMAKRTTSLHL